MKLLPSAVALISLTVAAAQAVDVDAYAITKNQFFTQSSAGTPTLLPTAGFVFGALIDADTVTSVTSAELTIPGNPTPVQFGPVPGIGPLGVAGQFDTEAAMEAVFPTGGYTFTINTLNDGQRTPALSVGTSNYPNTPTITNFAAAQMIDWTQPFTVSWGAFTGGGAQDFIQFVVERPNGTRLFATPDFGDPGALTGTATSAVVPANTLVPGVAYTGRLTFAKVPTIDPLPYPGALGVVAFTKQTAFPVKAPGTKPILTIAKGTLAGSFDLTWNADVGRTYDLVWSADFSSWTRVALVTAGSATEMRTDTPPGGTLHRFYRLQEPP